MSSSFIQLDNVDVPQADTEETRLRGVNWSIGRGEFWLVRGDQGSGKTDLIRTAAGLQAPAGGRVTIDGEDLVHAAEEVSLALRRQIGFVFEHGGRLLNHLSMAGNIALPLLYHGGHSSEGAFGRAHGLLEEAGLAGLAGLLPSRVSPVIQQRVSYLRAIAARPALLFVDHPVGPRWWAAELERLRTLQDEAADPITIVVASSEEMAWVDQVDHVAALEEGELKLETGS